MLEQTRQYQVRQLLERPFLYSWAQRFTGPGSGGERSRAAQRAIKEPPTPNSRGSLVSALIMLYNNVPALPFPRLVDYHNLFPEHHSTRSFNIIIGLAIKHSARPTAIRLFGQMQEEGIQKDEETIKLVLRFLVKIGNWKAAWQSVKEAAERMGNPNNIPLVFLVEFFGSPSNTVGYRLIRDPTRHGEFLVSSNKLKEFPNPEGFAMLQAPVEYAMRHKMYRTPFRILFALSRRLLIIRRGDLARSVLDTFVSNFKPPVRERDLREILDLVHLHLRRQYNVESDGTLGGFRHPMSIFHRYFTNSAIGLKPTPMSLFYLLNNLNRNSARGWRAFRVLRHMRAKWGARIENEGVRRLVAKFAIEDNRPDIAQVMLMRELEEGTRWREPPSSETTFDAKGRALMKRNVEVYVGLERAKRAWIRLGLVRARAGFVPAIPLPVGNQSSEIEIRQWYDKGRGRNRSRDTE
jgi:hypothetical protein